MASSDPGPSSGKETVGRDRGATVQRCNHQFQSVMLRVSQACIRAADPLVMPSNAVDLSSRSLTRKLASPITLARAQQHKRLPSYMRKSRESRYHRPTSRAEGVSLDTADQEPVPKDECEWLRRTLQPEFSPISQEQLAAEVKGIYAGLVMVEAKCMDIDAQRASQPNDELSTEQWQALVALHRTLLYEHHDFLMATQHPSANPALLGLATKYSMPARMWKHGIHAFLEVLRHRRPHSQEYMLAFIYLAYQMMSLLLETVPGFTDTWIECLGDLARYRMAIEEDREIHTVWGGVAGRWYVKAADRHPQVGRLYHHSGILERPSLRKFYLYGRALTSVLPFLNAKESLTTLYTPIVEDEHALRKGSRSVDALVICFHARSFLSQKTELVGQACSAALTMLETQSQDIIGAFGVPLAVTNNTALLDFGLPNNVYRQLFDTALSPDILNSRPSRGHHSAFSSDVHAIKTLNDILSPDSLDWSELASFLNHVAKFFPISSRTKSSARDDTFPTGGVSLHEDYTIRGLVWAQWYFAPDWFKDIEDDGARRLNTAFSPWLFLATSVLFLPTTYAQHLHPPENGLSDAAAQHKANPYEPIADYLHKHAIAVMVLQGVIAVIWTVFEGRRKRDNDDSPLAYFAFATVVGAARAFIESDSPDLATQGLIAGFWCMTLLVAVVRSYRLLHHPHQFIASNVLMVIFATTVQVFDEDDVRHFMWEYGPCFGSVLSCLSFYLIRGLDSAQPNFSDVGWKCMIDGWTDWTTSRFQWLLKQSRSRKNSLRHPTGFIDDDQGGPLQRRENRNDEESLVGSRPPRVDQPVGSSPAGAAYRLDSRLEFPVAKRHSWKAIATQVQETSASFDPSMAADDDPFALDSDQSSFS